LLGGEAGRTSENKYPARNQGSKNKIGEGLAFPNKAERLPVRYAGRREAFAIGLPQVLWVTVQHYQW
jgi:hypothetical protein